jgi:hypothetical protein
MKIDFRRTILSILRDTATVSTLSTAAIMATSSMENHKPFGAVNCICHIADGDNRDFGDDFSKRDTLLGLSLNASAILFWVIVYRLIFPSVRLPSSLVSGAFLAISAYTTDYHIVPKRLTPGFEKKLSGRAIFVIYMMLAAAFASLPPLSNKNAG